MHGVLTNISYHTIESTHDICIWFNYFCEITQQLIPNNLYCISLHSMRNEHISVTSWCRTLPNVFWVVFWTLHYHIYIIDHGSLILANSFRWIFISAMPSFE
jgi:hypothetical protein